MQHKTRKLRARLPRTRNRAFPLRHRLAPPGTTHLDEMFSYTSIMRDARLRWRMCGRDRCTNIHILTCLEFVTGARLLVAFFEFDDAYESCSVFHGELMLHRLGIPGMRSMHENFVHTCSPMTSNSTQKPVKLYKKKKNGASLCKKKIGSKIIAREKT